MSETTPAFEPAVPAGEIQPELTLRALLLGAFLGVVFGAASTYLALRVGLTTSASVPIAVLSIWAIKRRKGQRAILEHNIVQTTGSAGESVAAAVVFSVPALIFLGYPLQVGLTTLIALTGGVLGVLMMVPLRRYLIVKEHGVLRYPEGKACAEILEAGEEGGTSANKVFIGLGVGAFIKLFINVLRGAKDSIATSIHGFKGAALASDIAPELLGVGYIIGYRTSTMMVAGSLLASLILIPMIALFGAHGVGVLSPGTMPISEMSDGDIWSAYVRHIGAGAVAAGGIFALIRALPSIVSSIRASASGLLGGAAKTVAATLRTERDTPVAVLVVGAIGIVAFIWGVPIFHMNLLGAFLILVLGFLFAVVSSRITGEVGSSSCPLSGMTIGVLMAVCGAFLLCGWEGSAYSRLALMIGAIVCIAISNAGTCSQDLKTGYLVGATPVRQQGALLIGVLTSVMAVGWTAYLLNQSATTETPLEQPFAVPAALRADAQSIESLTDHAQYQFVRLHADEVPQGQKEGIYLVDAPSGEARILREDGIGAGKLRAPQAKLMATVIEGLLTHKLPWGLILIGVAIACFIELLGFRALTFAVGVYLPLAATMPVFLGGLARLISDKVYKRTPDDENEREGTLYCSGLIAGASILGILAALTSFLKGYDKELGYHPDFALLLGLGDRGGDLWGLAILLLIGFLIFRGAAPRKSS
ncbi:MAG: oligopeptide transporter, OPT family [Planctomycetes bacterium]|nr:oligopeptide transporter, OPT family [Planctomycetota bacterium]